MPSVRPKKNIAYAWGLNLVVLTLQIQPPWGSEPLGLPVNMRLHRKNGSTLIELAMEMINEVKQWLPERSVRVVGDGFYATLAGKTLDGITIISRIKRNANLYDLPPKRKRKGRGRPRTKGKKLAKLEKMAAHIQNWETITFRQRSKTVKRMVYTRVVLWYKVSRKPILLVISRDPDGKEKRRLLFYNRFDDDCRTGSGMLQRPMGNRRYFQKYKAASWRTAAADLQNQRPGACGWFESLAVLGVWLWYLSQKTNNRYFIVQPWNPLKAAPSFADAIACLRRELWKERINCMFGKSAVHDKKFKLLLEALAPAA